MPDGQSSGKFGELDFCAVLKSNSCKTVTSLQYEQGLWRRKWGANGYCNGPSDNLYWFNRWAIKKILPFCANTLGLKGSVIKPEISIIFTIDFQRIPFPVTIVLGTLNEPTGTVKLG